MWVVTLVFLPPRNPGEEQAMPTPAGCRRCARLGRLAKGGSIPTLETPSKTALTLV
ncbi:hypothetical protein H6G97_26925 [Nostoc flagelliforme FACHB-838]|uniref:Uncharacterized protein n=1 Tax=Nostoc flagelliforme FACHB-838 TaxID=2692904 RepID=A0ABR8DX83_9NOSO|nr:hypothetical protein [Nostoc flagelliforme FACHB-838]